MAAARRRYTRLSFHIRAIFAGDGEGCGAAMTDSQIGERVFVSLESPVQGISCPYCGTFNWIDPRWVTSSNFLMCICGCGEIAKTEPFITEVASKP